MAKSKKKMKVVTLDELQKIFNEKNNIPERPRQTTGN